MAKSSDNPDPHHPQHSGRAGDGPDPRPRLAYVVHLLSPFRLHVQQRIAREIPEMRLDTLVSWNQKQHLWTYSAADGAEVGVQYFPDGVTEQEFGTPAYVLKDWHAGRHLIRWFEEHKPAMVVMCGYGFPSHYRAIRWLKRKGVPYMLWSDSNILDDNARGVKRWVKDVLVPPTVRDATAVLPCGTNGARYYASYGATAEKTFLCPVEPDYALIDDCPPERMEAARKRFGLPAERKRFVHCARLVALKSTNLVIEAFARLADQRPEWDLVILGDGPLRASLEAQVPAQLKSRVTFTGFITDQEMTAAIEKCGDVLVHPGYSEAWGVVLLEAAAAGMAIIASNVVGAATDLVRDGESGVLIPPRNVTRLTEAMLHVSDPSRLEQMKTESRRVGLEFRERADLVEGLRSALRFAGTLPKKAADDVRVVEKRVAPVRKPRVLQVVITVLGEHGGIPVICTRLAAAQAAAGAKVGLLAYPVPAGSKSVIENLGDVPGGKDVTIHQLPPLSKSELYWPRGAQPIVRELMQQYDFVHIHALWEPFQRMVGREAVRAGVPYCVVLHGLLDHWTLAQSKYKKKAALALWTRRLLNEAAFLHVGNTHEREAISRLRLTAKREIIPNGVFLEEFANLPPKGTFYASRPELKGQPYILFLSRVHLKKGLDYLADAFAIVAKQRPDVRLVVAGGDEGYQATFERMIAAHGLTDRTHMVGALYGQQKLAAFNDAACFCLPSRQEGFSIAITESLGCGTPAVVSRDCHYPEVEEVGAGCVTTLDAQSTAEGLLKVLAGDREAMGARGRELVRSRFNWPAVAETTFEAYRRAGVRTGASG